MTRERSNTLYDAHAHAFRDGEEGRRWQAHSPVDLAGDGCSGDIRELKRLLASTGIERVVLLLFSRPDKRREEIVRRSGSDVDTGVVRAKVAESIKEYNSWGCAVASADVRFIPFVNLDPNYMSGDAMVAHLEAMVDAGARGVKLVPSSMRMYPDDSRLEPVFQKCVASGLPVVAQSGHGTTPEDGDVPFSRPSRWATVLRNFPELQVVLAHLGHGYEDDVVALTQSFDNVYTDTSLRLSGPPLKPPSTWKPEALVALVRAIGVERVLFGTNYPMVSPADYAHTLARLPLTDDERQLLAHDNCRRIVGSFSRRADI